MTKREVASVDAPAAAVPCIPTCSSKTVFKEWLDRERVVLRHIADELGITVDYCRKLARGDHAPGVKLRLRIQARTEGAVRFDSW